MSEISCEQAVLALEKWDPWRWMRRVLFQAMQGVGAEVIRW